MTTFGINAFVERQINVNDQSPLGGWTGTKETLQAWIDRHVPETVSSRSLDLSKDFEVIRIYEPLYGFVGTHGILVKGEQPEIKFEARRDGEMPVPVRYVRRTERPRPAAVDLVFYSKRSLTQQGESISGSDYDLVSINCLTAWLPLGKDEPMTPETLWRNYLSKWQDNPYGRGGTYREKWDDPAVFQREFGESMAYWANLARVIVDKNL